MALDVLDMPEFEKHPHEEIELSVGPNLTSVRSDSERIAFVFKSLLSVALQNSTSDSAIKVKFKT